LFIYISAHGQVATVAVWSNDRGIKRKKGIFWSNRHRAVALWPCVWTSIAQVRSKWFYKLDLYLKFNYLFMSEIDEKLIELVRSHEELYNFEDQKHSDNFHKNKLWRTFGAQLNKSKLNYTFLFVKTLHLSFYWQGDWMHPHVSTTSFPSKLKMFTYCLLFIQNTSHNG